MSITVMEAEEQEGHPHMAMFMVLGHLPLYEILTMSNVCKSLLDEINSDVLLWHRLIVESPLNSRLTDETLLKITSKANGRLKTLALMNCIHITDQGLLRVVEQNPYIKELHIPACTSITPEGILKVVEALCERSNCLTNLSINGIYNIQKEHYHMLALNLRKNLTLEYEQTPPPFYHHIQFEHNVLASNLRLDYEEKMQQPVYYHKRGSVSSFKQGENRRIIDLEICPKCVEVRMVYDCPKVDCCKRKECRGCIFCIPRCENCGGCVGSDEPEEGACGDILCLECWLQVPKCNFCNKPYCMQHTDWWCTSTDSSLLCRVCDENSHGYTYTDVL
ncbi:F-box protein SKIP28 [Trifolium pratense]|uniref:F-box protein SKIP28 n=1 Tax=Trifolium pratense TaxID=57577 RepID=UPI001E696BA8|nr:F-box protein SKIP28 [Trifolium pratense]